MSDTREHHGSLEEETEEPGTSPSPEDEARPPGGVRMMSQDGEEILSDGPQTPSPEDEQGVEYLYNEPPPEGVEVLDFDFLQAFLSLTDDLHQHPQVARVTRATERPVPEFTIRVVESGLGQTIAHELKSLYRMVDELSFRWESKPGSTLPGGALAITPFMRTFGHWVGELWPIEQADQDGDPEAQLRWQLRGFDMPEPFDTAPAHHGRTLWTVIALRDGEQDGRAASFAMYVYHPEEKDFLPLHLSLVDYLYCALGACGAPGWQLLFTDYDFDLNPWHMPHPLDWIDEVAAFFPTFDMQFFRDQYDAMQPPSGDTQEE